MSDVPSDVLREMLSRIPAESLLRLRSVCKAWKQVIDDPSFVQFHTKHLHTHSLSTVLIKESKGGGVCSVSLDRLKWEELFQNIVTHPFKQLIHRGQPRLLEAPAASCNGLILISHRRNWKGWVIWNPLFQSLHELPQPSEDFPDARRPVSVGFGYEAAADDYRVVRIDKLRSHGIEGKLVFYRTLVCTSMKLRSWRRIQDFPYEISFVGDGVFLNGSLHWQSRDGIAVLHLGREEFSLLPRPHPMFGARKCSYEVLDALNGFLFLSYYPENGEGKGLEVWVMRDYGVENSWMKLCSMDLLLSSVAGGLSPVAYLQRRRQIFLEHCGGGMFWVDLESNTVKEVFVVGCRYVSFSQFSAGSLLRLEVNDRVVVKRMGLGGKRKRDGDHGRLRLKFCVRGTGEEIDLSSF